MNCLLCKAQFMSVESLRGHYILEHLVDDNNETFRDMFSPNTNSKNVISVNWNLIAVG